MKQIDKRKVDTQDKIRKTYSQPQLISYGSLQGLTTGGSGNANEGEKGNAKPRP